MLWFIAVPSVRRLLRDTKIAAGGEGVTRKHKALG